MIVEYICFGLLVFGKLDYASGVTCPDIEPIQYADITTSRIAPYKVGTVANFTCDVGFKGIGKSSIICLENGRWSGSSPYCSAYNCKRRLKKVEKGRKCRKKCKRDADCKGVFNKCECDDWCGKSCYNPSADCPKLRDPLNGYILESGRSYGHTVTYGCNDGFTLTGPSTRRCRSDKKWTGFAPFCVPYSTCGVPGKKSQKKLTPKVIEGTNAEEGEWPWQALLFHNIHYSINQIYNTKSGFGGGTIINEEWILTAAHIFKELPVARRTKNWKDAFLIAVGMTTFPSTGHVIPGHLHIFEPEAVYFHPDFDQDNFDYDAALIRIGKKLTRGKNDKFTRDRNAPDGRFLFSRYIRPVCLPCMKSGPLDPVDLWKNFDKEKCNPRGKSILPLLAAAGSHVMVTGFGQKRDFGEDFKYSPSVLQQGLLKIVDNLKCAESAKDIQRHVPRARFTSRMFCATGAVESANVDSCQGDSGGPVVKRIRFDTNTKFWMQIGVVSWGWGCGNEHPGFYTSVSSVMSWVWQILDDTRIGTWKNWESWTKCSKNCGGGSRQRRRQCATKNCKGTNSESGECNTGICPPDIQCPPVSPPSYGTMTKNPPTPYFEPGSVVKFSCGKGFFLQSGPRLITCERGQWSSPERPVCANEFSQWTSWSSCTATCGGARTRTRKCLRAKDVISRILGCDGPVILYSKCGNTDCPAESGCTDGNLCLQGNINVDRDTLVSQASELLSQLLGKRR